MLSRLRVSRLSLAAKQCKKLLSTSTYEGVSVHNEWDPIEEMIVGTSLYANYPGPGDKFFERAFLENERTGDVPANFKLPQLMPQRVIDETEEDIEVFISNVKKLGIKVRRPEPIPIAKIKTFDWEAEHYFCYCPRDLHLAIGNTIIECPSGWRSRYLEPFSYHKIMYDYLAKGSRWISAPKGRLTDACFNYDHKHGESMITEHEMIFDAANILRFGRDIIYLVSDTGNETGAKWLQSTLGPDYKVTCLRDVYHGIHIDTTMTAIKPGLLLLNPTVDPDKLPPMFKKWEILKGPDMVETEYPATKGKHI